MVKPDSIWSWVARSGGMLLLLAVLVLAARPVAAGPARMALLSGPNSDLHLLDIGRINYVQVIDALSLNGYQIVSVTDTMLNRVKIRARNASHLREIVVSRASGHVLRDALVERYATPQTPAVVQMVPLEQIMRNAPGGIMLLPD